MVVLTLVLACSGKKKDAPAPAAGPAAPPATPMTTPIPVGSSPAMKPGAAGVETAERSRAMCEAALPVEARGGLRVEGAVVGGHMTCNLYEQKNLAASVTADCARGTSLEDFQNKEPKMRAEVIPDLGRGGWRAKSLMGITQFYDGQAECECRATAFKKGIDDLALARAFEAGLTAATAPKPPPPVPGEADPHCDDIVSPTLRDQFGFDKRVEQSVNFGTLRCVYTGKATLYVELDCKESARSPLDRLETKRNGQRGLGRYKKDLDIGRGAFLEYGDKVTFVDKDVDCLISTAVLSNKPPDIERIARAVEAGITTVPR